MKKIMIYLVCIFGLYAKQAYVLDQIPGSTLAQTLDPMTVQRLGSKINDENAIKYLRRAYLMSGDLKRGYELEDFLYEKEEEKCKRLWRGENLCGKTIYIFDNIGMGDVFCFMQYAKYMKAQGAKVILGTRGFLRPIMSSCPYIDEIIPRFGDVPECDVYVYMHKLPRMAYKAGFGIPCHEPGNYKPYLFADKKLIQKWKGVLSQDKNFKVGICYDASVQKTISGKIVKNDRSIPLHCFYELSNLQGVSLYSLQRVNGTQQLDSMPQDFKLYVFDENFDKEHGSFSDTAAVMKNLDLVITVDTSIAHLAGALGVPVWMLLNYDSNWRWFQDRTDTQWYPTMRIFRQPERGDWDFVMSQVLQAISKIIVK
ncbi:glycosyltransferase family 9 protein [Candidatus Dependentiae bacterium]